MVFFFVDYHWKGLLAFADSDVIARTSVGLWMQKSCLWWFRTACCDVPLLVLLGRLDFGLSTNQSENMITEYRNFAINTLIFFSSVKNLCPGGICIPHRCAFLVRKVANWATEFWAASKQWLQCTGRFKRVQSTQNIRKTAQCSNFIMSQIKMFRCIYILHIFGGTRSSAI